MSTSKRSVDYTDDFLDQTNKEMQMNRFESVNDGIAERAINPLTWLMALMFAVLMAGCGNGGSDGILGSGGASAHSAAKAITAYSLNGVTGTINEPAKTIAVTVPFGTNVTALVATFTAQGVGTKVGTAVQTSATTPNNFSSPVAYTVTAADTTTVSYNVVVTIAPNTAKALTSFSFVGLPGATGTINESAMTVAVTVPNTTNVSALVATFATTGVSVKVGTVVQTSAATANDFTSPVAYIVTDSIGGTATYAVTVTFAGNTAKALTAFSFAGFTGSAGTINEPAKTVAVTVPFGTNVTALVATFTTTGNSVKVGTTIQTSASTANNFAAPVPYIVTAQNGSTATYAVTVTVAPNPAKAMTAFSFAGYTGASGIINEGAKTIAVTVPFGTDVTTLVATFTSTGPVVKVGTAVQTSTATLNNFSAPVAYIVTAADATTATYTVTVTVAANTAKALTSYSFAGYPGATGTINEAAKTIAVTVPNGTDVTTLVATFATTGANVKVGTVVQTSVATANNFTAPVVYTVTAGDLSTVNYTVTVAIAASSAKAITAYSLVGVSGTINEVAKTIGVVLPSGTNVTALAATFTTTGASVHVGAAVQTSTATTNNFTNPVVYTVTAGDTTTANYTVTVTFALANPTPPVLGEAGRFVILANQAITTTGVTAITNGDIGIAPAARTFMAGFTPTGPAGDFTELTGSTWAGMASTSYAPADANPAPFPYPLHYALPHAVWSTTGAMLTQANTDLGIAQTFLNADPNPTAVTQVCETELGTLTKTRGVYKTASNVGITTGSLTLDAQGDPNAVFIFVIGGTLTTGAPGGSIVLANGAQAKNVFWTTAGVTSIGAGTIFYGSVFAATQVNVFAGAQITGSLYGISDRVTLIADTVTKAQ